MEIKKSSLTEHNNATVYNAATKKKKVKRRNKSKLGPDFVAPDGGWGWVVCIAAGFSSLSILPAMQQFGLIYRQRLTDLGFTGKEITTILNISMSLASLVGIVNGAMFRRFSFRQVAIFGSILIFIGIFLSAWCSTFGQYVLSLSVIYGMGQGLSLASVSLAVNTYFKKLRRRATGFTWTINGLGPIILPHISTLLLVHYGAQGTILIYAAFTLNALMCAMTFQPVLWHTSKLKKSTEEKTADTDPQLTTSDPRYRNEEYECNYCNFKKNPKRSIFSSQYLFNEDDLETPGYEITEPGIPMMTRANDGWFGSKISLAAEMNPARLRHKVMGKASMDANMSEAEDENDQNTAESRLYKPNYFNRQRKESKSGLEELHCTCAEEKALLQNISEEELKRKQEKLKADVEAEELVKSKMSFKQKLVKFFDLDLLKDLTFVNLAVGITILMFAEVNFSVLTPFILDESGYTNEEISSIMSMLAGMDICVRFLAPFALEKVKLDNRVLFAFGIVAIAIGRMFVTMASSYYGILALFALIGFGKGFRTIFAPLIIPSYVPLNRLPAASGLQLVCNSIFFFSFGPVLGIITDATSYMNIIHFLNLLTILALLLWITESVARRILGKKTRKTMEG